MDNGLAIFLFWLVTAAIGLMIIGGVPERREGTRKSERGTRKGERPS